MPFPLSFPERTAREERRKNAARGYGSARAGLFEPVDVKKRRKPGFSRLKAKKLKPGEQILFADEIVDADNYYDPQTGAVVDFRPKGLRRGTVIHVTDQQGILVRMETGRERRRKTWLPYAAVWCTTGDFVRVPDADELLWAKKDREYRGI